MILVTGDVHLSPNPRDAYRHTFMAETLPALIRKYTPERLIILGDLTEAKEKHSARLVNQTVKYLYEASQLVPVIIPTGNHDYTDPDNPFFAFVDMLPNVTWINKPVGMIGDQSTLILPHTYNWKRDWKDIDLTGFRRIFAHQTFQGAKVGPRELEGIPLDIFSETTRIISGDVHTPQTFDIVTYVGAPYLVDFGDDYKPRVLLVNGDSVKSIPVPGVQKRLLEINSVTDLEGRFGFNPGDILKVRVTIRSTDIARWPNIQKAVRGWGEDEGFHIHIVQPQVVRQAGAATARRQVNTRTDQELMRTYGTSKAVSAVTLNTGLELMEKA